MVFKTSESRIPHEPERPTLEKWLEDCPNLRAIFDKARKENRKIHFGVYPSGFGQYFEVIETKEDYAIVSKTESGLFDKGPEIKSTFIHPYAATSTYEIDGIKYTEELK